MSHYSCSECSGATKVTETRLSGTRLRRRRLCGNGHRITTLELPHSVGKDLIDLIKWLARQNLDDNDIVEYAILQTSAIITGVPIPEE